MYELAIIFALVSATLAATSVIVDRILMTDIVENTGTLIITSMTSTFIIAILTFVVNQGFTLPTLTLAGALPAIGAGVIKTTSLWGYFEIIKKRDATLIGPVFNSQPVFVIILGFILLGEILTLVQYVGAGLVVTGIVLFSIFDEETLRFDFDIFVVGAVGIMLVNAVRTILFKSAITNSTYSDAFIWMQIIAAGLSWLFLVREDVRAEITGWLKVHSRRNSGYIALSESVSAFSALVSAIAFSLGPASLVSPFKSTNVLFVFVFVIVLDRVFGKRVDDTMGTRALLFRGSAAVLMIIGILIALL